MGLFSQSQLDEINAVAAKSKAALAPAPKIKPSKLNNDLAASSDKVLKYFKDSPAILISTPEMLHNYVDQFIKAGEGGVDTETTGLDRLNDHIVGSSLYYPGGDEAYIPNKHLVPIFDEPYRNQISYEDAHKAFDRLVQSKSKLIFANADFDLSMIAKDYDVDLSPVCYYDVILAWRCIKENEPNNKLKTLYHKYVMKGKGDAMQFTDFFDPALFPYCKPEVAKLYAANDAKITYDLYKWQLPYVTPGHPKCEKHHLQAIASLVWDVEFPLMSVCLALHRRGIYVDGDVAERLSTKYHALLNDEKDKLAFMVQTILADSDYNSTMKSPFRTGHQFNPNSSTHVRYLFKNLLKLDVGDKFDKNVLSELNVPVAGQILKVRNCVKLLSTYVDKLPMAVGLDKKIHATFKSIGADTGRFSSEAPNMQNIPSHAEDIRHMFRATPGYVMLSSDYSQQEPKLTAFVSQDEKMIKAFQDGRDIYATIASLAFNLPYENCLEFHPETKEYQPEGKARRGEAKTIVLGRPMCYALLSEVA